MYVLEESNTHEFNDLQFGFIPGRGTEIATALLNDVTTYNNIRGSAGYICSSDAEGAFDAIPHSILLLLLLLFAPNVKGEWVDSNFQIIDLLVPPRVA